MLNDNDNRLPRQYSIQETADMLGVSTKTIRRWINDGRLKAYRYGHGRIIRIDEPDLVAMRQPVNTEDTSADEEETR